MNLQQEAYKLVSNAGQKLSKDYVANGHVKTVAGFVLKCICVLSIVHLLNLSI